jgi:hypothetical protein
MTKSEFESVFIDAINSLRQQAFVPYDTGNLKINAIKGMWITPTQYRIYVDEQVAPYVFFTQEKWSKGINPNAGWVEKAVNYLAHYISQRLGGSIQR